MWRGDRALGAGRSPVLGGEQMVGAAGKEHPTPTPTLFPSLRVPFPLAFGESLPECLLAPPPPTLPPLD